MAEVVGDVSDSSRKRTLRFERSNKPARVYTYHDDK